MEDLFEELLAFFRRHGHHHIPNIARTRGLYAWAAELREQAALGELPARLLRKLEAIDFPFDEAALSWERSFAPVAAVAKRKKSLPPPQTPVGAWIRAQLTLAELGGLPQVRARRVREVIEAQQETRNDRRRRRRDV